jgi:hypothetical protein
MASMPFDASIYQNSFHNASPNAVVAALGDPNLCDPPPPESTSYFDLARLDGHSMDDPYAAYLALARTESAAALNDVFVYTSSQALATPPVQTVSPTEIHGHAPFYLCGSPGVPVLGPPPTHSTSSSIPQTILGSSACAQQQVTVNQLLPSFPTPNATLAVARSTYSPPTSPERRHSLPSPQRPSQYHSDPFHRRSSWVAPVGVPMHIQAYLQYPFFRSTCFSGECESPYSTGMTSLGSVSYGRCPIEIWFSHLFADVEPLALYARLQFARRVSSGHTPHKQ